MNNSNMFDKNSAYKEPSEDACNKAVDIDCHNNDTFGEGALEEDWEADHNNFVGNEFFSNDQLEKVTEKCLLNDNIQQHSVLDEELADYNVVRELDQLLLTSDHDQEIIDPAIVSLKKEAAKKEIFHDMHSLEMDRQLENRTKYIYQNIERSSQSIKALELESEDTAILTAVPSFSRKPLKDIVVKVEDLERDHLQASAAPPGFNFDPNPSLSSLDKLSLPGSPKPLSNSSLKDLQNTQRSNHSSQEDLRSSSSRGVSGLIAQLPTRPSFLPFLPPPPGVPPPGVPPYRMWSQPPGILRMPDPHMHTYLPMMNQYGVAMNPATGMAFFSPRVPPPNMMHGPFSHRFPHNMPPPPLNMRYPHHDHHLHYPHHPHHIPDQPRFMQVVMQRGEYKRMPPNRLVQPPPPNPSQNPLRLDPEHSKFIINMEKRNNKQNQLYGRTKKRAHDPYANLMTQKEKDWVTRIQRTALQSDRPEIDDYYYQNFVERRLREGSYDANGSNPKRLITHSNPITDGKKYVPVQYNNSLGKLTTSSVYNPRQIIEIVANEDDTASEAGDNGEHRQTLSKRLVIYKTIEKAYIELITMEGMIRSQLTACFEGVDSRGVPVTGENVEVINLYLDELVESLGFSKDVDLSSYDPHDNDTIFQVMKIAKGRKLIIRMIRYLFKDQRVSVVQSVIAHLANLVKRDCRDKVLVEKYKLLSEIINTISANQLLILITPLSSFALKDALKDEFGATLIFKLISCGSSLMSSESSIDDASQQKWTKFVNDVIEVIVSIANPNKQRHNHRLSKVVLIEKHLNPLKILFDNSTSKEEAEIKQAFDRVISCGEEEEG